MATLKDLTIAQIDEAIAGATERRLPLMLTIPSGRSWRILHSRFVGLREGHLLIEMPIADDGQPHEFKAADSVGVSFKFKHHKHVFSATVAGSEKLQLDNGTEAQVLSLCSPTRMKRLQRRAFRRATVPAGRIVRASFWTGGLQAEPHRSSLQSPVWSGKVVNISAGGALISCEPAVAQVLDPGETVGMHITFGVGEEAVSCDAQFRHLQATPDEALVGFRFVGLGHTPQGQEAMQQISSWTARFERHG